MFNTKIKLDSDTKRLVSNFLSLSVLQGAYFFIPLITIPYLVGALGIEKFGMITFAQVLVTYFVVLVDYGFTLSATRDISVYRDQPTKLAQIYSAVLTTKIILCTISFLVLVPLILFIPIFQDNKELYIFSFAIVLGQVFIPVWFFQGMEQMKIVTYLNVLSKILFTALVFLVIKSPEDYVYVNVVNGIGSLVATVLGIGIIAKRFRITYKWVGIESIIIQLKEGWHFFITNVTIHLSLSSNVFVLGLFASPIAVGYYSIAEKAFLMLRAVAALLYQVVYPRICKLAHDSFQDFKEFVKKVFIIILAGFLPACLTLFFLADYTIFLLAGKSVPEAALVLKILSFAPLFGALNIPACQSLLAFHQNRTYAIITTSSAVLNVGANIFLATLWQEKGTAIAALATEMFVTISLYAYIEINFRSLSVFRKNSTHISPTSSSQLQ